MVLHCWRCLSSADHLDCDVVVVAVAVAVVAAEVVAVIVADLNFATDAGDAGDGRDVVGGVVIEVVVVVVAAEVVNLSLEYF